MKKDVEFNGKNLLCRILRVIPALILLCIVAASCTVDAGTVSTPVISDSVKPVVFSPAGGKCYLGSVVEMTSETKNTEIWYSLNKIITAKDYSKYGTKGSSFTFTEKGEFKIYAFAVDGNGYISKRSTATFTVTGVNENANDVKLNKFAELLCTAKINENNKIAFHSVNYQDEDTLTYCVEFDTTLKHSTWVGFYWDSNLIRYNNSVTRYDQINENAFCEDPDIPESEGGVVPYNHTSDGYDRGHLCASADRFYDQDANAQTFYLTNMSPQLHAFNANFWGDGIEGECRTLSKNAINGGYKKVYVIKGGDLQHLLKNYRGTTTANDGKIPTTSINGTTVKGLAVPAYYYTVLLAETEDGEYKTLGFYVPHVEDFLSDEEKERYAGISLTSRPSKEEMKKFVYSIDYIEERTGIDFFCNLTDSIEEEVESRSAEDCIGAWTW